MVKDPTLEEMKRKIRELEDRILAERSRTDDALRKSEERFRNVYHTAPLAFVIWDGACQVTDWNDRAEEIFGWSRQEVIGRNFFEFLIPENARPRVEDVVESLLRGEVEPEVVNENLTKSGELILCQWHNSVLCGTEGTIIGAMSLALDITESSRAENELRASREQLRSLARHLQTVREKERAAVARVIHDELGQALTALKLDLGWLQRQLRGDQQALVAKIHTTIEHIDDTVRSVQRISSELRPGLLDDLGLVAAIEWNAQEFRDRTSIACEVFVDPRDMMIHADLATTLFRIFQEALTNVARHAQASSVRTCLTRKDGTLELEVTDDGRGITDEQVSDPKSFGLIGMRERIDSWKGRIDITGRPNEGTTVKVLVPEVDP